MKFEFLNSSVGAALCRDRFGKWNRGIKPLLQLVLIFLLLPSSFCISQPPNLVIVMTDEHNLRTLGCYRDLMSEDQAFVWGKGVKVDTPHIDSLAQEGALVKNFYVSSPSCSPSRAAFMTGLLPHKTGVPKNDVPMHDHMVTFAEILGRNGYATGYLGKWHLDGTGKPQWEPERKFGWQDNRYMFNRGHYKKLKDTPDGPRVDAKVGKDGIPAYDLNNADHKSYATDFLMDRTIDFIREHQAEPFCVMLSLPDPHGPNRVREPYWSLFKGTKFEEPRTMFKTPDQIPGWIEQSGNNWIVNQKLNQEQMAAIFGMVQCIDDNMGKLLAELKRLKLEENTIVVFTSDHGDLMGEHQRHNKGNPYEMSVKSAFILKQPGKIPAGKVIHKTMTSADFGPTVLSLMGIEDKLPEADGRNFSRRFLNQQMDIHGEAVSYFRAATMTPAWVAGVSESHKLVIPARGKPWLFDLKKDPDELTNYYDHPAYRETRGTMTQALKEWMVKVDEPGLKMDGYHKWLE